MNGFSDAIAENFNKIRTDFEKKSYKLFEEFNEDLFMDAYIKCSETLKNKEMSKEEYIKYYWVSYVNGFKTLKSETPNVISIDDPNREHIISLYTPYNISIDITCETIISNVKLKFGDYYAGAWLLHILENKTYKELKELGYDFKFNDVFKNITKWIRIEFKNARFAK